MFHMLAERRGFNMTILKVISVEYKNMGLYPISILFGIRVAQVLY